MECRDCKEKMVGLGTSRLAVCRCGLIAHIDGGNVWYYDAILKKAKQEDVLDQLFEIVMKGCV